MTVTDIRRTLHDHFALRNDLYHVVTGPKRETWFSAECIAALARAQSLSALSGEIISGEDCWSKLNIACGLNIQDGTDGLSAIPDINSFSLAGAKYNLNWLAEVKLVDDWSFDLGNKGNGQDLATQLERARRLAPMVPVYGLIFVVHCSGRGDEGRTQHREHIRVAEHALAAAKKRKADRSEITNLELIFEICKGALVADKQSNREEAELVAQGNPQVDCFHTGPATEFFAKVKNHIDSQALLPANCVWLTTGIETIVEGVPPLGPQWSGTVSLGLGIVEISRAHP